MKTFTISALLGATQAVELGHFAGRAPFMVYHVADDAPCKDLNSMGIYALPGTPLFYFDQQACACVYDDYYLNQYKNFFQNGCEPNPLVPGECAFSCQIQEIYNHGLDENCQAVVDDLPYDYRTAEERFIAYGHEHKYDRDDVNYDLNGHFGTTKDCPYKTVHLTKVSNVVFDDVKPAIFVPEQ